MGKLAGERRALAAAVIGFYMSIFFLMAFLAPNGFGPAMGGLAGVYALAFLGLVAGYFWARWFGLGIGIYGLIGAVMSIWQMGPEPLLIIYGATQVALILALTGKGMAAMFDGRLEWRERYHLDEHATNRLGKSVIRVGVSLPMIVTYALAPKQPEMVAGLLALGLAAGGVWALFRMRTWGVLALGGAAVTTASTLGCSQPSYTLVLGIGATVLLAAAVVPFLAPMAKKLRS